MNAAESILLCRYVRAACPQQAMDEYTPETWLDGLSDLSYADCDTAVRTLARRQPFIAPSEVRDEVRRIRTARLAAAPAYVPSSDTLTVAEQVAEQRAYWRAVGDGQPPGQRQAVGPTRTIRVLTRSVDGA